MSKLTGKTILLTTNGESDNISMKTTGEALTIDNLTFGDLTVSKIQSGLNYIYLRDIAKDMAIASEGHINITSLKNVVIDAVKISGYSYEDSTSKTTGSVVLNGGIGIGKSVFCDSIYSNNGFIRIYGSGQQALVSGNVANLTNTFFTNTTSSVNDGSFSVSAGLFTIAKAGLYLCSYSVYTIQNGLIYEMWISVDGNVNNRRCNSAQVSINDSQRRPLNSTTVIQCPAGGTLQVSVYCSGISNIGGVTQPTSECIVYRIG